jgi:PAS domain S-box-containing protein
MYSGGTQINQRTAQIIRFSGLIIPVVLTFYGLLIHYGAADSHHYLSDQIFFTIMIPWIMIAAFQFLYISHNGKDSAARLITYHALSAAYILFVSGFETILAASWILLFLASYAYFSDKGMRLSIMGIVAVAATDSILHSNNGAILLTDMISLIGILLVGVVSVSISQVQEIDTEELTRSKAEESLQRDRILTIVNNLADAVLSTDTAGVIRVFNAASLNLLDTNNSLEGKKIDEVLSVYDKEEAPVKISEELKQARGTTIRDDLTMTIEGEVIRLEVTYSPIRSTFKKSTQGGTQDGYILILRDITKAKSLEEERDEFISVVSHELRTPITIAEGTISNVQMMMDRKGFSEKILRDAIDTSHEQVMFLAKMVNDLSTLSRAERGVADIAESIDVRSLVDDLYEEYSPQAKKKGLHLNLDLGTRLGSVAASQLYLRELIQNFITNSIKYTKEGSVTVCVERHGNNILFEVRDTGIGISKSDQSKIFSKFYRSEDYRTRETGGTGLGLYVAVKLAKKLGTKIEMTSRLNHGSSFSFELPIETK